MAINISARPYKFFVNGKDYTAALIESTNWDTNGIDQSGLVKTTASFTLAQVRDLPGSLNDRINTDWNIGKSVLIQIVNSAGSLENHPCGALRILSSQWNYETQRLQINAGCLISLLSFKAPTDPTNELELEPARLTGRSAIVRELLTAANIETIVGLGDLPYPLYYPFSMGSYLETAGKILYSALHFGRIDSNEIFVVEPITLNNPVSINWQIGNDELWYRRLSSAEAPRELIEVRGTRQVGEIPQYPIISYSERYGNPKFIDPTLVGSSICIYEQLQVNETYGGNRLERRTRKNEPIGLIIPNTKTGRISLINSYFEEATYSYQANDEGKLVRHFGTIYKTYGEVLKEYFEYLISIDDPNAGNNSGLLIAELYTVDYLYDKKDRVSKILTTRYKTTGELLSGQDTDWTFTNGITPSGLSIAESIVESWVRQPNNFWIHRIDNYKTAGVVNPGFFGSREKPEDMTEELFEQNQRSQQLGLVPDNNASINERSNSGQTVPPAAERRPAKVVLDSEEVCGEAIFRMQGGNPYKEKKRSYSVEYLGSRKRGINEDTGQGIIEGIEPCDNEQCKAIAELEGALLAGRFKGEDIGVDIKDELFNFSPLRVLDCTEPDGTIRRYALDDSHWYIGENRAIANFGAIWLGDVREGSLAKPYAIAQLITGTVIVGGNAVALPYSLILTPASSTGGIAIGGMVIAGRILISRGGVTVGGELVLVANRATLRGGLVLGGIVALSSSIRNSGGLCVGGVIQCGSNIKSGIIIGGTLIINKQLIVSGGALIGGNIIIALAGALTWNNSSDANWNNLDSDGWNSIN